MIKFKSFSRQYHAASLLMGSLTAEHQYSIGLSSEQRSHLFYRLLLGPHDLADLPNLAMTVICYAFKESRGYRRAAEAYWQTHNDQEAIALARDIENLNRVDDEIVEARYIEMSEERKSSWPASTLLGYILLLPLLFEHRHNLAERIAKESRESVSPIAIIFIDAAPPS